MVGVLNVTLKKVSQKIKNYFEDKDKFCKILSKYFNEVKDDKNELIQLNNTIVFMSGLVSIDTEFLIKLKSSIVPLTYIVKEKIGPLRKSAAILLSKLC